MHYSTVMEKGGKSKKGQKKKHNERVGGGTLMVL